jgi:hypothetical protein
MVSLAWREDGHCRLVEQRAQVNVVVVVLPDEVPKVRDTGRHRQQRAGRDPGVATGPGLDRSREVATERCVEVDCSTLGQAHQSARGNRFDDGAYGELRMLGRWRACLAICYTESRLPDDATVPHDRDGDRRRHPVGHRGGKLAGESGEPRGHGTRAVFRGRRARVGDPSERQRD